MRKEVFIVKNHKSRYWLVQDDCGFTYQTALSRWGARRFAKTLIERINNPQPPVKEFVGEIN